MAQWYCAGLENRFPHGYPGSIPGLGVLFINSNSFDRCMIRKGVAALVYRKTDSGIRYLLLKRKKNWIGWEWLKGGCKKGENEKTCLSREIDEEISVKSFEAKRTKFTHSFYYTKVLDKDDLMWTGAKHRIYLVEVFSDKIKVDKEEHSRYNWFTEKEALKNITWKDQRSLFKKMIGIYIKKNR